MTELPDGYYEVEKTKTKINLDLPIHIFVLNFVTLQMLEFYYDFLEYFLPHEDFQITEMDTDSNYLGITAENV